MWLREPFLETPEYTRERLRRALPSVFMTGAIPPLRRNEMRLTLILVCLAALAAPAAAGPTGRDWSSCSYWGHCGHGSHPHSPHN